MALEAQAQGPAQGTQRRTQALPRGVLVKMQPRMAQQPWPRVARLGKTLARPRVAQQPWPRVARSGKIPAQSWARSGPRVAQ